MPWSLENHGNVSKSMREAGYSDAMAKNPQALKESSGWIKLMEEHISDDRLAQVHSEGLNAMRGEEPDHAVRHKYLDTGYKLKGSYAPEKKQTAHLNINVNAKTKEIVDRYEEEFRQSLLE